jgi:hypothetical protein
MLTPARMATSPRRSPGTRLVPTSGWPACCGVSLVRREMRNWRTSERLSIQGHYGDRPAGRDALSVHLSSETPARVLRQVSWVAEAAPRGPITPAVSDQSSVKEVVMRVAVMSAPGKVRVEQRPEPRILEQTDAIIRLSATCICGSDLWPYRGGTGGASLSCSRGVVERAEKQVLLGCWLISGRRERLACRCSRRRWWRPSWQVV